MFPGSLWELRAFRANIRLAGLVAHRWLALAGLGALSLLVYWVGLILPYSLGELGLRPLRDIAKLTRGQPAAQAGFVLTLAVLSGLYYLAWRTCRGRRDRAMWAALLLSLLAINLSVAWLYPIGAADVFDNILRGRITAVYGGNPFYQIPKEYPADSFFYFTAWRSTTSAYGPLWELLAAGASRLLGNGRLANVLGFKAMGLIFYAGCTAVIAGVLNRRAPGRALQGVCLFALNPLVIYETAGNAHNDIVMVFFMLLGMAATLEKRFTWAALALVAGGLIKFTSLLLLPVVLAAALRSLAAWPPGARLRYLLLTGLACTALGLAAYAVFWQGGDPVNLQRRLNMFTTSLPAVAQAQLESPLGVPASRRAVGLAALALTAGAALWQAGSVWKRRTDPVRGAVLVLLFYLLLTCQWFEPWYAIWPLAFAALLPEGAVGRTSVLLSYAALWKTVVFDFFLFPGGQLPPRVWRETWLGPATLGVVWLYAAYCWLRGSLAGPLRVRPPAATGLHSVGSQ